MEKPAEFYFLLSFGTVNLLESDFGFMQELEL